MPKIASYYASIGIDFDTNSLRRAQTYMKRIEKVMEGFKKRSEKTTTINLRVRIDRAHMIKTLNTDVKRVARSVIVPLTRFNINLSGLTRAINTAMVSSRGQIRIGALLSSNSLSAMRQQIVQHLSNITISPKINPRTNSRASTPVSGGGGNSAYASLHMGGLAGGIMRYGFRAIPIIGGAYGLSALGNIAQELESNKSILEGVAAGGSTGRTGEDYFQFLSELSKRLGITTRAMVPQFTQMLAASRGTPLEESLQSGFKSFMEYSAGMNIGEANIKRSLYAITQMIGKGKMASEEVRRQLGDVMPTFLPLLAKAVLGDSSQESIAKLDDMMRKGLLTTSKYLPLVFEQMNEENKKLLPGYFKRISYARGTAMVNQEQWLMNFMAGGGEQAIKGFWGTYGNIVGRSGNLAPIMGDITDRLSSALQGLMLIAPEFSEYVSGNAGKGNVFTEVFGEADKNEFVTAIKDLTKQLQNVNITIGTQLVPGLINLLKTLWGILSPGVKSSSANLIGMVSDYYGNLNTVLKGDGGFKNLLGLLFPFLNSPTTGQFGSSGSWNPNDRFGASGSWDMPTNNNAANKLLFGNGKLDKLVEPNMSPFIVNNNTNITVDNQNSAEQISKIINQQTMDALRLQWSDQMSTFPKVSQ